MSREPESLESVLADERGQAAVLRHNGHAHDAELIERVCSRVSTAAEEYLRFLSEPDARLRTNKSVDWLRTRFPEWMELGHAKKIGNVRYYRMVVLPPRANISAAREEGRRAGAA
jgi:hypothetical protein